MASLNFIPPKIPNKSLTSAVFPIHSTGKDSGYIEYECPALGGAFSANISTSNIAIPLLKGTIYTPTGFESDLMTSNGMVNLSNFNIVKLDLDNTKGLTNLVLDVYYNSKANLKTATKKFTTIIEKGELFYRDYPVYNQFFNFTTRNTDEGSRAVFNGRCTLSRYTQFGAPTQLSDQINRFSIGTLERVGNDFYNDILINRVQDVVKTDRIGVVDSIQATKQTFWNNASHFNFTSNVASDIYLNSTDNADTMDVLITGRGFNDTKAQETITLTGTTNAVGLLSFKIIDNMEVTSPTVNAGQVKVYRQTDNEVMNVMDIGAGRSTSLIYCAPENTKSVVRHLSFNGTTGLETESKIKLYKVVDNVREVLVYQNNTRDAQVIENIDLDILLNGTDSLYGVIESANVASTLGDSFFSGRVNILEYANSQDKII